jgi:hypothetical protein
MVGTEGGLGWNIGKGSKSMGRGIKLCISLAQEKETNEVKVGRKLSLDGVLRARENPREGSKWSIL